MNVYLAWSMTGLYYLLYPIYFAFYFLLSVASALLSPLSTVVLFLLQPLILFGKLAIYCTVAPFHFLQRFETIYIYLGVASLTGITCGLFLHLIYSVLYSSLNLASEPAARGPTARQYRASRRKAKYQSEGLISPVTLGSVLDTPGRGRHGLLAQTIHEEDSDF